MKRPIIDAAAYPTMRPDQDLRDYLDELWKHIPASRYEMEVSS